MPTFGKGLFKHGKWGASSEGALIEDHLHDSFLNSFFRLAVQNDLTQKFCLRGGAGVNFFKPPLHVI